MAVFRFLSYMIAIYNKKTKIVTFKEIPVISFKATPKNIKLEKEKKSETPKDVIVLYRVYNNICVCVYVYIHVYIYIYKKYIYYFSFFFYTLFLLLYYYK